MINSDIKICLVTEQSTFVEKIIVDCIKNIQLINIGRAQKKLSLMKPHIIIFNDIAISKILSFRKNNFNPRFIIIYKHFPSNVSELTLCQISSLIDQLSFTKELFFLELNRVIKELETIQKSFVVQLNSNYGWQVQDRVLYNESYNKIDLSKNEAHLMEIFICNANKILNIYSIIDQLETEDNKLSIKSFRNLISKLRNKIPQGCIQSIYGEGYRFKMQVSRNNLSLNDFHMLTTLLLPLSTINTIFEAFCNTIFNLYEPDRSFVMYCDFETNQIIVPVETSTHEYPGAAKLGIKIPITPTQLEFFNTITSLSEPIILSKNDMKDLKKEDPKTWDKMQVPHSALVYYFKVKNIIWMAGLHQCSHQRYWVQEEVIFLKHCVKILQEKMQQL
jgi:DNA-binding winged helix-turn-helix (wHTH) protein